MKYPPDQRGHLGGGKILGGDNPLDHQKVCRPVAEGNHSSEAEHDSRPVDTHGVIGEAPHGTPKVGIVLAGEIGGDAGDHPVPSSRFNQAEDRDQQRSQPDEDKLQDFVENRRTEPAQGHVDSHRNRGDPDTEVDVPAEQHLHHNGHGVHIDAGHQNGHNRERDGAQCTGRLPVAKLQVTRYRVGLRNVVEGHHDQSQEQYGGNGPDPVKVCGQNPVLIGGCRPAHQLQRAEVCRQEAQTRNPGGHLPPGQEEVFSRLGIPLEVKPHREDRDEVGYDDQ